MTGPAAEVAAVRLAVRRDLADRIDPGEVVLVACSGGADSLALVAATAFERRAAGFRVIGVTVDHGLQDGSAAQADRVVAQMVRLGCDETASIRVTVDPGPAGIEAGARQARYAALAQLAEHFDARAVLLGHTLDDQAETVLLGLTRGSGGRSIAGMRPVVDDLFRRPLLEVTRAQTEAACRAEGLEFWTDPHNADPRFLRARIRHTVMPVLERELGPGIAAALARTGALLREDMEFIDMVADQAYADALVADGVDLRALEGLADAIRSRVLRRAAIEAGALASELAREHVHALLSLSERPGKVVRLPGHLTGYVGAGLLRFRRTE